MSDQVITTALPTWCAKRYSRSWIDALQVWIELRPWPAWVTYLIAWLSLTGTHTVLKWIDGTLPVGAVFPFHVLVHGTGIFILALIHYLDGLASRGLDSIRPLLDLSNDDVDHIRYRLTTMPARATLFVFFAGVVAGIAQRLAIVAPDMEKYRYASEGPVVLFELLTIPMFVFPLIVVYCFHTLRQLRLIDELFRRHARIDLFNSRPLYAFSSLAARNAIAILAAGYAWIALYPADVGARVVGFLFGVESVVAVVAIMAFVLPLWGAHVRLNEERIRRRHEAYASMNAAMQILHDSVRKAEFSIMDGLTKAIGGLSEELRMVQAASTWPWSPLTLRAFVTAVFLPMFLWASQQVLSRTLLA